MLPYRCADRLGRAPAAEDTLYLVGESRDGPGGREGVDSAGDDEGNLSVVTVDKDIVSGSEIC